ncbi:hypothetical protein EN932_22780 [Mesorhizobium sp. M7A.F.Ca.US.002.01.1.1]|uniref:hypothetical protein n=1 Tax=Mesorhizobium sp. M7A.F.Ca.US.002.01.1.1 TaxID=2496700 RepID=UPI000FD1AE58|nr:hypothetical protein [Mesorhizobium sp. M7A.F.Ca.US.002.01.1.1]RVA09401.1 hypothetical protein EN932_22780 [Mesorhizobium sp. M7A.F.Ca.US.002.01.1.1]
MSNLKAGDRVRCIKATSSNSKLKLDQEYTVVESKGNYIKVAGLSGIYYTSRFELVAPKGKARPSFGQVKSVTVNMSDIHDVLTQYVRFGLGINATVEKLIDKFPEAVELVLKHEPATA